MQMPALVAIDWGTSSLRAYLLDAAGDVLEERHAPFGIQHLPQAQDRSTRFEQAYEHIAGHWLTRYPGIHVAACGMVGSAQGWVETPYAETAASMATLATLSRRIHTSHGGTMLVAPGIRHSPGNAPPDVMRGEEIQIFGALAEDPVLATAASFILPGTHSKWARVQAGTIKGFATYMTGELFALLRSSSTLGQLMPEETTCDEEAFTRGVLAARQGTAGALLNHLFSVRTLGLSGGIPRTGLQDYLSGMLIGHELADGLQTYFRHAGQGPLVLVGDAALTTRYAQALRILEGPRAERIGNTAPRGLFVFARTAGFLEETKP